MAKSVMAVILDKPQSEVYDRLKREYANVHKYTSTCILVPVPRGGKSTEDVARTAGIKGTNRDATGVVFKLNAAYSGYTDKSLWAWLSDVEGS